MPKRALASRLDVFDPATGALRASVTAVRRIEIREASRDEADDAGFDLANRDAILTGLVRECDEVRAYVKTEGDADFVHIWSGVVDSINSKRVSRTFAELPVKAQDFVMWRMARAFVTDSYENMSAGAIVRAIVQTYTPSITATSATVEDTGTLVPSITFNGESVLAALRALAELADAEFHGDKDKVLHFYEKKTKASGVSVDASTIVRGSFSIETNTAGFGNVQKVRGGSRALLDQTNGEAFGSWSVLDGSTLNRVTAKVYVTKSRLAKVELWTNPTGYGGDLRLRIQAGNAANTAPIDVNDDTRDLVSRTLSQEFLAVGDWTTFLLAEHVLPPGGSVWLIVECASAGQTQRVGLDATGPDLMFRTYYPVPVIVERQDSASVARYGKRELPPISDKNIATEEEATLLADMELARRSTPARQGSYEAFDIATLASVGLGETVLATFPDDDVPAGTELIIVEKTHVYDADAGTYTLRHSFADAERVRRVEDYILALARKLKRVEDSLFGRAKDTLVDLIRSVSDTARVSDSATSSEHTGAYKVGAARVGFSVVG